jgi:hypothetical protein
VGCKEPITPRYAVIRIVSLHYRGLVVANVQLFRGAINGYTATLTLACNQAGPYGGAAISDGIATH